MRRTLTTLALLALPATARAQTVDDLRACGPPPADTVPAWLTTVVRPLDQRQGVPDFYVSVFGDELVRRFQLPSPLALRGLVTHPTVLGSMYRWQGVALRGATGEYELLLRRNGPPSVTTALSSMTGALDSAIVNAMMGALSDEGLATFPAGVAGDSAVLHVSLFTADSLRQGTRVLGEIRTERIRLDSIAHPDARTTRMPFYPPALEKQGVKGTVSLRFVVAQNGVPIPESIVPLQYADARLVQPAIEHVVTSGWIPAMLRRCAIPGEYRIGMEFPPRAGP